MSAAARKQIDGAASYRSSPMMMMTTTTTSSVAMHGKRCLRTPPVGQTDPGMLVPGIVNFSRLERSLLTASPRFEHSSPNPVPSVDDSNSGGAAVVFDQQRSLKKKSNTSRHNHHKHGRSSPCHDLGYHTLVTSPRLSSPGIPQTPLSMLRAPSPSHWSDSTSVTSPSPFNSPTPLWDFSVPNKSEQLENTDQILTTFKGKRLPRSSYFDRLTDNLVLKIFSFLSTNQICICARVCRRWYFLAWEPQLWSTITLTGEKTNADRAIKTLVRLLCCHTNSMCLTVEKVVLNGCNKLSDKGLSVIAKKCPELRYLEVRACSKLTNTGINEIVDNCINLEKLDLSGCSQVTSLQPTQGSLDTTTTTMRQLYLQFLDMTDCHILDDGHVKTIVRSCPQLTHLYLRRCVQLTDISIKYIASYCVMLREFSMSDCVQLTDFGLYELAKLGPNLRYLSVAKCDQISDAGVKQIARHCYKMRYLNVRGCEAVSDDSMGVIARSCPRLRALDVGKCDVTDHGLKLLSEHCPNIRKLSVKSCDIITDKGIQYISYYCRGLQQLNIQDCNITIDGYRTVKKYCRRCIIEHTNPGFY